MKLEALIIGSDFNFSLCLAEVWGPRDRVDPLSDFFMNLLDQCVLVDVAPVKIAPTWRNKQTGEERVAKRIDRFLVS
jgi:hypothetical protein